MRRLRWTLTALPVLLTACSDNDTVQVTESAAKAESAVIIADTTKLANEFTGTVYFDNVDPGVVALINAHFAANTTWVTAGSSLGSASTNGAANDARSASYELSAETVTGGLSYNINAYRGVWFTAQTATLNPKPAVDPPVDFHQTISFAKLDFQCNGVPFVPDPNTVTVWTNAHDTFWDTTNNAFYVTLRDAEIYSFDVDVRTGSSWNLDMIQERANVVATGVADAIVTVPVDLNCNPSNSDGILNGRYDVSGKTERTAVHVGIAGRADGNARYFDDTIPTFDPATSSWVLPNLLTDSLWTSLQLTGFLEQNNQFTYFRTDGFTPGPIASGTQTTTAFLMDPAFFTGQVRFYNPELPIATSLWSWESLARVGNDVDLNGIPTRPYPYEQSSIRASNGNGGYSATSFDGDFTPASHQLLSSYSLPLMSAANSTQTWYPDLQLTFISDSTITDMTQYRYGSMQMSVPNSGAAIAPNATGTVDYIACFNEVVMDLVLDAGTDTLSNPTAYYNGSYSGLDPDLKTQLDYYVSGGFSGLANTPATTGTIRFPVPRGHYSITPRAQVTGPSSGTSDTWFSPFTLDAGCGQFIYLRDLAVSVTLDTNCLEGPDAIATANVSVSSRGKEIGKVYYTVGSGTKLFLCSSDPTESSMPCVPDQTGSFVVTAAELAACNNQLVVTAETAINPGLPGQTVSNLVYVVEGSGGTCDACVEEPVEETACVVATGSLNVGNLSSIDATVAAEKLVLGVDSTIVGDTDVVNSSFYDRSTVTGTLTCEIAPTVLSASTVTATTIADVTVPTITPETVTVGTVACNVGSGVTGVTFNPANDCFATTIGSRSHVVFGPGVYDFDSLNVEPEATIEFQGDVTLKVQGAASFGSRVMYTQTTAGQVRVYSNASVTIQPAVSGFPASIKAPNGSVIIYSNVSVKGCVAAKYITMEPSTQILGGASTTIRSCTDGIKNGTETGVDCGGTCSACTTCTDGTQNGTETGVDCGGSCAVCVSSGPCGGVCSPSSTSGDYSASLGSTDCIEIVASRAGATCWGASTITVNGLVHNCADGNFTLPARVSGGYCIQVAAGAASWAGLAIW